MLKETGSDRIGAHRRSLFTSAFVHFNEGESQESTREEAPGIPMAEPALSRHAALINGPRRCHAFRAPSCWQSPAAGFEQTVPDALAGRKGSSG